MKKGKRRGRKRPMWLPYAPLFLFCGYLFWEVEISWEEHLLAFFLKAAAVTSCVLGASFMVIMAFYSWLSQPAASRRRKERPKAQKNPSA